MAFKKGEGCLLESESSFVNVCLKDNPKYTHISKKKYKILMKTVVLAWLGFSIQPLPFCLFEHSEVQISVIVSWFNFRLSDIASIWLTNFKSKPSSSGPLSTARQSTTLQTVHDYIILYIKYMTNYSKIYFEKHSMECKILIKMSISSMPMKFCILLSLKTLA